MLRKARWSSPNDRRQDAGVTVGRGFRRPPRASYVSIVLKPPAAGAEHDRVTSLLTLASGVALADAIDTVAAIEPEIKWPNDLIVRGRKLAGILAERVSNAQRDSLTATPVILGYGINVGANAYPPELSDRATDFSRKPVDSSSERRSARRRSLRFHDAIGTCSPAGSMLFSTLGGPARRQARARTCPGRLRKASRRASPLESTIGARCWCRSLTASNASLAEN